MNSFFSRMIRRIETTYSRFYTDRTFSVRYGLLRILDELGGRVGLKRISSWAHNKKDQWILKYLKEELDPIIKQYCGLTEDSVYSPLAPIWVCWWSGEETSPPLVKRCISSIRSNANGHPIKLITRDNYCEYLDIPAYILDKVSSGQMCLANFSDYLRFSLLKRYGGLWLDATIYCTQPLQEELFHMPLFTCKSPPRETTYISGYRWTAFCFGGYRGGLLFRFMHDAFDLYWQKNDFSIDYLLVDYLIETAYSEIPAIRTLLDAVPYNNLRRDDLQAAMNKALPATEFESIINPDTAIYKLSWKENYQKQTRNCLPSIYSRFLEC